MLWIVTFILGYWLAGEVRHYLEAKRIEEGDW